MVKTRTVISYSGAAGVLIVKQKLTKVVQRIVKTFVLPKFSWDTAKFTSCSPLDWSVSKSKY